MSKTAKKVTSADLLALLNAGNFDDATSKVLSKALASNSAELPLQVVPPRGKWTAMVQVGAAGNDNFPFRPKNLSPRLLRSIVETCETKAGRDRILGVCDEAADAKPAE